MNTQQKQEIQKKLEDTRQQLIQYPDKAIPPFLNLMSRLYKYSFSDQLAIFTQRPKFIRTNFAIVVDFNGTGAAETF